MLTLAATCSLELVKGLMFKDYYLLNWGKAGVLECCGDFLISGEAKMLKVLDDCQAPRPPLAGGFQMVSTRDFILFPREQKGEF